jgi:hypothetical protein
MHLTTTEFGLPNEQRARSGCDASAGVLQFSCTWTGYTEAPPSAKSGKSMTVNITNRSHRVAYIVGLLLLAVALTTALVLAAEQDSRR